jgi:hypothetical protein
MENAQNGVNKFEVLPNEMTIDPGWLEQRDIVLRTCDHIQAVDNQTHYTMAEIALKQATATSNGMEKFRKAFGQPFLDATRKIKAIADEARKPLEDEKARVNGLMTTYLKKQEAARRVEEERIAKIEAERQEALRAAEIAAAESDDPFAEQVVQQQVEAAINERPVQIDKPIVHKTMSAVTHEWTFEITNPNNVPRGYCVPDESLIRSAVKKGGVRSIPGVRIFEDIKVRSK